MDIFEEISSFRKGSTFSFSVGDDDRGCEFQGKVIGKKDTLCKISFCFEDWCETDYDVWEGTILFNKGKVKKYWIDQGDDNIFSPMYVKGIFTDIKLDEICYKMKLPSTQENYKKNDGKNTLEL
jgi:hypothetical protein